ELYELIEENIQSILIGKAEIEDKINENLIKFPNDERLIQMKEMMKEIFKEPYIPEYNSSSESECDDDKDDNSVEEDHDEHEMGTYKKDEADNNDEEEMANKKATNKKTNAEFDPFDDPEFGKYYVENEHLFVPTQPRAEKKKDQTDDEQLESFSAELRKKNQQQESERQRKGKKEKDQIGSSSQDTPVFSIDNSLQGSQPTFDLEERVWKAPVDVSKFKCRKDLDRSTAAQWKTGLLPKNDKNHRMQMDKLRSRIAAKILLHEVNIFKKKMSDYATKMTEAGEGGSN
ncbi:hypothetical protein Tco_0737136, partial [Tanacetum coccineum]